MKKLLIFALSVLTAFTVFAFTACGTYIPANPGNKPGTGDNTGGDINNGNDGEDETPFTAKLVYGGSVYIPETPISAKWNDGSSVYTAEFNESGVAEAYGLDGDYVVTLTGVPEGYTYNANRYTATNDSRDVEIELYKLVNYVGDGSDLYGNAIKLSEDGAYRVTFTEAGQQIYCEYRPSPSDDVNSGRYAIESIMDISANEVNPRLDVYVGNAAWKPSKPTYSLDTGGESSVYTKNFKYEIDVINTKNVYSFAIKFDKRSHVELPVSVDFIIYRSGDYFGESSTAKLVFPTEGFKKTPEYSKSQYRFVNFGKASGDRILLDSSQVYLNPNDGYYHYRYQNASGGLTDTILYALITQPNNLVDFFEGNVRLNLSSGNYYYFVRGYDGYCTSIGGAANIPEDVKEKIEELDYKSYPDYVNSDGVYAVTPEFKTFLLAYSRQNSYFLDGNGWGEDNGYDSSEADQWLFACGYYVER